MHTRVKRARPKRLTPLLPYR